MHEHGRSREGHAVSWFSEAVVEGGTREFFLPFLPLPHLQWRG